MTRNVGTEFVLIDLDQFRQPRQCPGHTANPVGQQGMITDLQQNPS